MSAASSWPRVPVVALALGCGLLGPACSREAARPDVGTANTAAPRPPTPTPAQTLELELDATGWSVTELDLSAVQPLEQALASLPGLRHLGAEVRSGAARLSLEFEDNQDRRAAVLERVAAARPQLPEGLPPPVLRPSPAASAQQLTWFIDSPELDPVSLAKLHGRLLARCESIAGVTHIDSCAPRQRIVVELDAQLLRSRGVSASDVARALEDALPQLPGRLPERGEQPGDSGGAALTIASLRGVPVPGPEGAQIQLGYLAALRYGFDEAPCVAASAAGLAASATVHLDSPAALTALRSALADAARELPAGIRLAQLGPDDTRIRLSLPAGLAREQAAELIGRGFSTDTPSWLVEAGITTAPCVATGVELRLSVPGSPASNRELAASLGTVPGVDHVELLLPPLARRLWLTGPDPAALRDQATSLARRHPGLRVHLTPELPELQIRVDRARVAELGGTPAALQREVELARGTEVGTLLDGEGTATAVLLRMPITEGDEVEALAQLPIQIGEQSLPLSALAEIVRAPSPGRLCRRDLDSALLLSAPRTLDAAQLERDLGELEALGLAWEYGD